MPRLPHQLTDRQKDALRLLMKRGGAHAAVIAEGINRRTLEVLSHRSTLIEHGDGTATLTPAGTAIAVQWSRTYTMPGRELPSDGQELPYEPRDL